MYSLETPRRNHAKTHDLCFEQNSVLHGRVFVMNPIVAYGFAYPHHLEYTFILDQSGVSNFIQLFDEIPLSNQNGPRWDVAFCGVTFRAMLFAYVPQKGRQAKMS